MWDLYSIYETIEEAREAQEDVIFSDYITKIKEQHGKFALYMYYGQDWPEDIYDPYKDLKEEQQYIATMYPEKDYIEDDLPF